MGVQGTYLQLNCSYKENPNLACYTFRNSEEYIFLLTNNIRKEIMREHIRIYIYIYIYIRRD